MTNSQRLAIVRACLTNWLSEQQGLGGSPIGSENPILRESVLIRNEFYCGRRFHTSEHQAVWFIEEDELKIYRNSGELVCVLSSTEINSHAAAIVQTQEHGSEPVTPDSQGVDQPGTDPNATAQPANDQPAQPTVIKMPDSRSSDNKNF